MNTSFNLVQLESGVTEASGSTLVCLFIAVAFIILCSCEDKKKSKFSEAKISGEKIVQKSSKSESVRRDVINFGVTPWQDEEIMKNIFKPLLEYLMEKTKYEFVLNISPDIKSKNYIYIFRFVADLWRIGIPTLMNQINKVF